ncbi:MAG: hypothetical protein K2X98_05585 [Alphaproteobacteria bacterium]|nr:hypothetical protein [Alphaproteobacteria bacterium]
MAYRIAPPTLQVNKSVFYPVPYFVKIHGTAHMKADGTWYVPDSLHADDLKN